MSNSNRIGEEVLKLLTEYSDVINEEVHAAIKKEAQKAKKEVSAASPKGPNGYAKSWAIKDESTRITSEFKIYNKLSGLPHLLEYGHTTRNGTGRTFEPTPAYPHIADVNNEFQASVMKAIEKAIMEAKVV